MSLYTIVGTSLHLVLNFDSVCLYVCLLFNVNILRYCEGAVHL